MSPATETELLWKPFDEAAWQAWVEKGRAQDRRDSAARIKVLKWVAIPLLVAAAGFGFRLSQ